MFTGSYIFNIDYKGRIFLPDDIRKQIKDGTLMLTVIDDTSFILKDANGWKADEIFYPGNSQITSYILKHSYEVKIKSQGRITIPNIVLKNSNIGNKVVIIGQGDFIEVTDYEKYLEYEEYNKTLTKKRK